MLEKGPPGSAAAGFSRSGNSQDNSQDKETAITDDSRGADGLFRKGRGGDPDTRFKAGDPDNPRKRQKRQRDAQARKPGAKQELKREEMRAELVALDVLERMLSRSRQTTAPRLPRLPHGPHARREADRLAARSMTRALRAMQRIARDPNEAPDVRVEVVRLLLERGVAGVADGLVRGAKNGADGKEKKEPKVIVVRRNVPRPWNTGLQQESATEQADAAPPVSSPPSIPEAGMPRPEQHGPRADVFAERQLSPALPRRPRQEVAESEE